MAVLPIKSMNFMINFIHMGIRWADRVSNKEIWKRTGQVLVGGENGKRHTLKKQRNSITKKVLDWIPRTRDQDEDQEAVGEASEIKMLKEVESHGQRSRSRPQNREEWGKFVKGLYCAPQ